MHYPGPCPQLLLPRGCLVPLLSAGYFNAKPAGERKTESPERGAQSPLKDRIENNIEVLKDWIHIRAIQHAEFSEKAEVWVGVCHQSLVSVLVGTAAGVRTGLDWIGLDFRRKLFTSRVPRHWGNVFSLIESGAIVPSLGVPPTPALAHSVRVLTTTNDEKCYTGSVVADREV